jgi:hypothetical protein
MAAYVHANVRCPMRLKTLRALEVSEPLSAGHAFLSSASGLVRLADTVYVIADDEHHLAVFALGEQKPGRLIRLHDGVLPHDAAARKTVKPDFEILLALPPLPEMLASRASGFRLLAMGSGSAARRMHGVLVYISAPGVVEAVTQLNLRPMFTALAAICDDINLEGAIVRDDRLILFNRGNMASPMTQVFSVNLLDILAGKAGSPVLEKQLAAPYAWDVPLTVTDACALDNGHILLSTVAEATGDSYADGAIVAAAFLLLDAQFNLIHSEFIEPICKIEGISAQIGERRVDILCVSDADNPDRPSSLYSAVMRI